MCFFKFKNFIPYGICLIRFDILISNWTQQRHWWSLWCLTTKSFASLIRSHNMFQLFDFCFSSVSTIILLFQMFFSRLYFFSTTDICFMWIWKIRKIIVEPLLALKRIYRMKNSYTWNIYVYFFERYIPYGMCFLFSQYFKGKYNGSFKKKKNKAEKVILCFYFSFSLKYNSVTLFDLRSKY